MATVEKWDWQRSNGDAPAAYNVAAYNALRHGGRTDAFSFFVWNDLVNKVSAQRLSWGDTAWLDVPLTKTETKLPYRGTMTAQRFNAVVNNMPTIKEWPWRATLGRTEIRKGDRCYGLYFILLTDALNHWIDTVPVPFLVDISAETSAALEAQVCAALRIRVEELRAYHNGSALVRPDPSIRFGGTADFLYTGSNTVTVFNVGDTGINVFFHYDGRATYSLYPTNHVIIDNPVAVTQNAKISFGGCDLAIIDIPIHLYLQGLISSLPSFQIAGSTDFSAWQSLTVGAAQGKPIVTDFSSAWRGQIRIEELYSELIKAIADQTLAVSMSVQAPQGTRISGGLSSLLGLNVSPGALHILGAKSNMPIELGLQSAFSLLGWDGIKVSIPGQLNTAVSAVRARSTRMAAVLENELSINLGMYAFQQLSTGLNMPLCSEISTSICSPVMLPHSVQMDEALNVGAKISTNAFDGFSVNLAETLAILTAPILAQWENTAAVLNSITQISTRITAQYPEETAVSLSVTNHAETALHVSDDTAPVVCRLTDTVGKTMSVCLIGGNDNIIVHLSDNHAGTITLDTVSSYNTPMVLNAIHGGNALVGSALAMGLCGELHAEHGASASIGIASYVLASELDDTLVSDLDEILISNVEYKNHDN